MRHSADSDRSSPRRRRLSLREYIRRRNGVPLGAPKSLRNMLRRSLGAGSFAGFWRFWNPIFGYYLGRYSYAPLQSVMPRAPAFVLTFSLCGTIHDLVTSTLQGAMTFLFTSWFFFLAIGALIGNACRMNLSHQTWPVRAGSNVIYLGTCLLISVLARRIFGIP